jgi:uncharacterized protein (TIGR02118 family)
MVKLIYCLRRLPHLSREEFQRYWRENHGPLVSSFRDTMHLRRYVQCHTFAFDWLDSSQTITGRPEPFDGVAELWWESFEDFSPSIPDEARTKVDMALYQDECKFIDIQKSPVWLTEEFPFITDVPEAGENAKPDNRVKFVYILRKLAQLPAEQFHHYWRENHGPLVKSFHPTMKVRRYIQSHTVFDDINRYMQSQRSRIDYYDGVAELWWDSVQTYVTESQESPHANANRALFEDESKFIDHSKSPMFLTKEWVFVNR